MDTNKPGPSTLCVPSVVWQSPGTHVIHIPAGTALHLPRGLSSYSMLQHRWVFPVPRPFLWGNDDSVVMAPGLLSWEIWWHSGCASGRPTSWAGAGEPGSFWPWPLERAPERALPPRGRPVGGRCPGRGNATGGA